MTDDPIRTFARVERRKGHAQLLLGGEWTVWNAGRIEAAIDEVKREIGGDSVEVVARIEKLDTSGGLLLKKVAPEEQVLAHLTPPQRALLKFLPPYSALPPQKDSRRPTVVAAMIGVGRGIEGAGHFLWAVFVLIGRVAVRLARNLAHPRHFRLPAIVRHMQESGVHALVLVSLLAVLISMVITYQGAVQLRRFGAGIYTIDLTVIALLREMGALVTAIMVAGRSGSAFAAEIGVMTLREEVNALRTMGLDPIEVLVVPRIVALLVTLPLLTFVADIVGLAAGGVMSFFLLDISLHEYVARVHAVATPAMFFVGLIKAPVFAFAIAVIGCFQGLNVSGSAESIGKKTTLAVVQAIFVVIMADALFSVIFSEVGI